MVLIKSMHLTKAIILRASPVHVTIVRRLERVRATARETKRVDAVLMALINNCRQWQYICALCKVSYAHFPFRKANCHNLRAPQNQRPTDGQTTDKLVDQPTNQLTKKLIELRAQVKINTDLLMNRSTAGPTGIHRRT